MNIISIPTIVDIMTMSNFRGGNGCVLRAPDFLWKARATARRPAQPVEDTRLYHRYIVLVYYGML